MTMLRAPSTVVQTDLHHDHCVQQRRTHSYSRRTLRVRIRPPIDRKCS